MCTIKACIKYDREFSDLFKCKTGLRQGRTFLCILCIQQTYCCCFIVVFRACNHLRSKHAVLVNTSFPVLSGTLAGLFASCW